MSPVVHLAYDENNIKPGWIALVLVLLLALATFLLWRSMNTQLGKIRAPHRADLVDESRTPSADGPSEEAGGTPDEPGSSAPDDETGRGEGPAERS